MKKIILLMWICIILSFSSVLGDPLSLSDPVKVIEGDKVVVQDQSKDIYSVELVSNTDQCLFDGCQAIYEVCNRDIDPMPLSYMDFNFYDSKDTVKSFGYQLFQERTIFDSRQIPNKIPCQELQHRYNYTEDLKNGTLFDHYNYVLVDSVCQDGYKDVEFIRTEWIPFIKSVLDPGQCKRVLIKGTLYPKNEIDHVLDYDGIEFKTWAWWNSSWNSRQNITIEVTENPRTNYQVQVVFNYSLYTGSYGMRENGEDVRFTDDSANLLHYWIEAYDDTFNSVDANDTIVFWVNVTDLPVGNNTIIAYFNNSNANTTQSGNDTFIFYHDFEHHLVDGVEFDMGGSPTAHPNTRDGYLLTNNTGGTIETLKRFWDNASMQWRFGLFSEATNGFNAGGFRLSAANAAAIIDHPDNNNDYFYVNNFDSGIPPVTSHQGFAMEYTIWSNQTDGVFANFSYWRGGEWKSQDRSTWSLFNHPLEWGMRPDGLYTGQAHDGRTYWVFVRNFIDPQPGVTMGQIETVAAEEPPEPVNEVPVTYNTTITPSTAYPDDPLNCSAVAIDDNLQLNMTFTWTLNGDPQSYDSVRFTQNNTLTWTGLLYTNTTIVGDNVTCAVTTTDGINESAAVTDTITIIEVPAAPNEIPVMQSVTIDPAAPDANESLNCSALATDDSIPLNFTYSWTLNTDPQGGYGSVIATTNNTLTWTGVLFTNTTAPGDNVTCTVTASDGINDSSPLSDTVTVVTPAVPGTPTSKIWTPDLDNEGNVMLILVIAFLWIGSLGLGFYFKNPGVLFFGFLFGVFLGFMFAEIHPVLTIGMLFINAMILFTSFK